MRSALRFFVFCGLALAVASPLLALEPGPAKVGELELIDLGTPDPYPIGFGDDAMTWVVDYPGATYIRVHFSKFDLAPGDWVEISNPSGSESYRFTGQGPHGNGSFWASTIVGDSAVIRLQATVGGASGLEIDSFGRGMEPIFGEPGGPGDPTQPESVCGTTDWRDVECYNQTGNQAEQDAYDDGRAAVKALIGCCSSCTAFKVSDSGQFMTNNHCTSSQSGVQSTELRMEFQNSACGGGGSGYSGAVFGNTLLATGYTYDYTLMTTTGNSSSIPCLSLDDRLAPAGERIYIAGHPSGGVKKLSYTSTHSSNPSGFCEVDGSPVSGRAAGSDVGYYCDTTNGSSGSPVISATTRKVVALHHFGGCLNSGGRSDRVLAEIGALIDSCDGSGGGTCGNGALDPGEDCDGSLLGGATCQSLGFDGGTLACTSGCSYDTSGCTTDPGTCSLGQKGDSCGADNECCSGKCRGKRGAKRCK